MIFFEKPGTELILSRVVSTLILMLGVSSCNWVNKKENTREISAATAPVANSTVDALQVGSGDIQRSRVDVVSFKISPVSAAKNLLASGKITDVFQWKFYGPAAKTAEEYETTPSQWRFNESTQMLEWSPISFRYDIFSNLADGFYEIQIQADLLSKISGVPFSGKTRVFFHKLKGDLNGDGVTDFEDSNFSSSQYPLCFAVDILQEPSLGITVEEIAAGLEDFPVSQKALFVNELFRASSPRKYDVLKKIFPDLQVYTKETQNLPHLPGAFFLAVLERIRPGLKSPCRLDLDFNDNGRMDPEDYPLFPKTYAAVRAPLSFEKKQIELTLPENTAIEIDLNRHFGLPGRAQYTISVSRPPKFGTLTKVTERIWRYKNTSTSNLVDTAKLTFVDFFGSTETVDVTFRIQKVQKIKPAHSSARLSLSYNSPSLSLNQIGILVNDSDPDSIRIANFYRTIHDIPAANFFHVRLPPRTGRLDVDRAIDAVALKNAMDAITPAVPDTIQGWAIAWRTPNVLISDSKNRLTFCMSLATSIAYGAFHDPNECGITVYRQKYAAYYNSKTHTPWTDHQIRPAMHVAASTFEKTQDLIRRGKSSLGSFPDSPIGILVRVQGTYGTPRAYDFAKIAVDPRWSGISWQFRDSCTLRDAPQFLMNLNSMHQCVPWSIKVDEAAWPKNLSNLMFYFHGSPVIRDFKTNQFLPGALADHLTSFGGVLGGFSGQTPIESLIDEGATASYGCVQEPMANQERFPLESIVVDRYLKGETALTAYWKSVKDPIYGTFVGDPLARPYGNRVLEGEADSENILKLADLQSGSQYTVSEKQSDGSMQIIYGPFFARSGSVVKVQLTRATSQIEVTQVP